MPDHGDLDTQRSEWQLPKTSGQAAASIVGVEWLLLCVRGIDARKSASVMPRAPLLKKGNWVQVDADRLQAINHSRARFQASTQSHDAAARAQGGEQPRRRYLRHMCVRP
jgi:hypothetical protein